MTIRNPLVKLVAYYGALTVLIVLVMHLFPALSDALPVGKAQALIAQADGASANELAAVRVTAPPSFAGSIVWLVSAVAAALATALPVSWVYMQIRSTNHYDQSVVDTIVVLPMIVTGIVVIVQNSLALAFSLAGIAGIARYRNNLKSSGDLLFILLVIGIGLACGIGAAELALVMSAAFNLCFLALWATGYGERAEMTRFLSEVERPHRPGKVVATTVSATVVTEEATCVADDDKPS